MYKFLLSQGTVIRVAKTIYSSFADIHMDEFIRTSIGRGAFPDQVFETVPNSNPLISMILPDSEWMVDAFPELEALESKPNNAPPKFHPSALEMPSYPPRIASWNASI
eukprot:TRINITY_DN2134_c0_g1_i10.p4 TRINITY_DN2134_c0_g1~~TRINITY_DN2134_c0_g1_i10.p4  ORF type:complete len:108 (-),score=29.24 TRINITY_DN2134_c0_g1_i10:198-521(-)